MRPGTELRASDAERENTVALLQRHASTGRLTMDEFDERSGRAYAARTRGELAVLSDDLPVDDAPHQTGFARRRWVAVTAMVLAGLTGVGLLGGFVNAASGMMAGGGMCH